MAPPGEINRLAPYPPDPYREPLREPLRDSQRDPPSDRLPPPPDYLRSRDSLDGYRDSREVSRSSDDRGADKWITDQPTNTIILKGMPVTIDENDVSKGPVPI